MLKLKKKHSKRIIYNPCAEGSTGIISPITVSTRKLTDIGVTAFARKRLGEEFKGPGLGMGGMMPKVMDNLKPGMPPGVVSLTVPIMVEFLRGRV